MTTIALAIPLLAAAQDGHVRSSFPRSYTGPWQLYSTVTGLDISIYTDFPGCRQAALTGPGLACKPVSMPSKDSATPPVTQPAAVPPPVMNGAFPIDASSLPKGDAGFGYDRVQPTSEVAPASPDIGAFRIPCSYSHMAFDDPIAFPDVPAHRTCTPSSATPAPMPTARRNRSPQAETRRASAERSTAAPTGCRQ